MADTKEEEKKPKGFHILISLIEVWEMQDQEIMKVPDDVILISEAQSIEIEETYKKLIGTASVKFPRGTVIRKTVTKENEDKIAQDNALQPNVDDAGVINEVRNSSEIATVGSFHTGQRIRISLGYTTDPEIAALAKVSNKGKNIFNDSSTRQEFKKHLSKMFDGYITKVSVDTPIELHCENLASGLKNISCPKKTIPKCTVNMLLEDGGKFDLLKGSGIKLLSTSVKQNFDIGKIVLHPDLSVADVLTEWAKFGMHCFITEDGNGNPALAVGRTYFSKMSEDATFNIIERPKEPVKIDFEWNVAQNGLNLTSVERKYLAVEAEGVDKDDKMIHLTVAYDPKWDSKNPDEKPKYRVVNESKLSKKAIQAGKRTLSNTSDKIDLRLYTKIPYHSRKIPITKEQLRDEAKKYMEGYNPNGIEGSLTLFGDLNLRTGTKVYLYDRRYPGKNGQYVVEEVRTTFGTGGYRQTIKLPYCIKRDNQKDPNNNEQG